jgi:hypothetical protein
MGSRTYLMRNIAVLTVTSHPVPVNSPRRTFRNRSGVHSFGVSGVFKRRLSRTDYSESNEMANNRPVRPPNIAAGFE